MTLRYTPTGHSGEREDKYTFFSARPECFCLKNVSKGYGETKDNL